jgi:hypothetical protein
MDIEDAALMYEGWGDGLIYDQQISRKATMIICEVFNKTMGGKGVIKNTITFWELPGDKVVKNSLIEKYRRFREKEIQKELLQKHESLGLKNGVKKNGKR